MCHTGPGRRVVSRTRWWSHLLQHVKRHVEAYARQRGLGAVDIRRSVFLDDSTRGTQCCILLIFRETSRIPVLVAKAAPTDLAWARAGKAVYRIEFENLLELERMELNVGGRTTPEPAGMWIEDGILVTLQSALPGRLLKNVAGRSLFSATNAAGTIDRVLQWWLRFQRAFRLQRQVITEEIYRGELLSQLSRFKQRFVTTAAELRLLDDMFLENRRLLGAELPQTVRHGDFCTANIMLQGEQIGVFDWEFPLRHQLPLFDLFSFFASLRFPFAGFCGESSHFDSFLEVYWGGSHVNRIFRETLHRVCADFEIPQELVGDLLLVSLIQIANLKYERLLEMQGIGTEPAADREATDAEKRARWQSLGAPARDDPFACIRDGVCENIRHIAKVGLPDLSAV